MDLSSSPLGAEVWADGSRLGSTPLLGCGLPEGNLRVTLTLQGQSTSHELRISASAARSFVWEVETGRWTAGQ